MPLSPLFNIEEIPLDDWQSSLELSNDQYFAENDVENTTKPANSKKRKTGQNDSEDKIKGKAFKKKLEGD